MKRSTKVVIIIAALLVIPLGIPLVLGYIYFKYVDPERSNRILETLHDAYEKKKRPPV